MGPPAHVRVLLHSRRHIIINTSSSQLSSLVSCSTRTFPADVLIDALSCLHEPPLRTQHSRQDRVCCVKNQIPSNNVPAPDITAFLVNLPAGTRKTCSYSCFSINVESVVPIYDVVERNKSWKHNHEKYYISECTFVRNSTVRHRLTGSTQRSCYGLTFLGASLSAGGRRRVSCVNGHHQHEHVQHRHLIEMATHASVRHIVVQSLECM